MRRKKLPLFLSGVFVGIGLTFSFYFSNGFTSFNINSTPWEQMASPLGENIPLPLAAPIIQRQSYTLAYDGKNRNPLWVYRCLTPAIFEKNANRIHSSFQEDPQLPPQIRSTLKDYEQEGFDRGHLASAADASLSQETMNETFFLSNISPQLAKFNRGYWRKLEQHLHTLVQTHKLVHVFLGPLYLPTQKHAGKRFVKYQVIGENNIAVPTHFFALILLEKPLQGILSQAYIIPHKELSSDIPLEKFATSVEEIERASGVIFSQSMVIKNH